MKSLLKITAVLAGLVLVAAAILTAVDIIYTKSIKYYSAD